MRENFISDFRSREERHYCAILFAWLIESPQNLKVFLNSIYDETYTDESIHEARIYYEFTAIRELIFDENDENKTAEYKKSANLNVLDGKGDIQKKKPDMAIYLPHIKELILFEAKFELKFEKDQILGTRKYGEYLKEQIGEQISNVRVVALGHEYYLNSNYWMNKIWDKLEIDCARIGWMDVLQMMQEDTYHRLEIERGLQYLHDCKPKMKSFVEQK